jgi:hypothetical protein
MSQKITRRQLIERGGLGVAGLTLGGPLAVPPPAKGEAGTESVYGVVTSGGPAGQSVVIALDAPFTGKSIRARAQTLRGPLARGERVALRQDPSGSEVASPLFMTLIGPIEKQEGRELVVEGQSCSMNENSTFRDQKGQTDLISRFDSGALSVGQSVVVVCRNYVGVGQAATAKIGKLTVQTLSMG